MKLYDKLDLRKIIMFWLENSKNFKRKNNERLVVITKKMIKITKEKEEKRIEKTETNVKYELISQHRIIRIYQN
jgi:hypothetical protein